MSVRGVAIRIGTVVPIPMDDEAAGALERVEIVRAIGERGSFRLQFRLEPGSSLPDRFLSESGDLVRVVISTGDEVAMDGVLVEHCLSIGEEKGRATLVLAGEDLTLLMDLIDVRGRQFAAVPAPARVQIILAAYASVGVVPSVVPPRILDVPAPTDIAHQNGSDYAYVRSLAEQVGYRFTLDPGPAPGSSIAYWGPEPRDGDRRPSLVIDVSDAKTATGLELRFDAAQRVAPEAIILHPTTKTAIPIPAPAITALTLPLGRTVPPAHRRQRLRSTAKLTATTAASQLLAVGARSAEAMSGRAVPELVKGQKGLRPGQIVEVRGAGNAFSGLFLVRRVRHVVTGTHHHQDFEIVRAGIGAPEQGQDEDDEQ
jgi:hypothetical protein